MRITLQTSPLAETAADWLLVGHWEKEPLTGPVTELDAKLGNLISKLREQGDSVGKAKELTLDRTLTVQHGYSMRGTKNYSSGKDVFLKK